MVYDSRGKTMTPIQSILLGAYLMSLAVLLLSEWVDYKFRPIVIWCGDLVYFTSEGTVRKATLDDTRVIGVAPSISVIQREGYHKVEILVGGKQ